jgi:hypothetical protein
MVIGLHTFHLIHHLNKIKYDELFSSFCLGSNIITKELIEIISGAEATN